MVQILPFAGWRYDLSQVGALSEVTSPSSDALDAELQHKLYRQHPCNVIRLIMNREEPGDQSADDRITRAEDFWRMWRREGILIREHGAAFHVIESLLEANGGQRSRWSVMGRMRLPESIPQSRADCAVTNEKVSLRAACRAEFSPVTVLLGSEESEESLEDVLERAVRLKTPVEYIDDAGQHHRIWPVTDKAAQVRIEQSASLLSAIVTEGESEFFAALQYRDSMLKQGHGADPNDPMHFVLAWFVSATDSPDAYGPVLFPIQNAAGISAAALGSEIEHGIILQYVGNEPTACLDAMELAGLNQQQPCVAFGTPDGHWSLAAATDPETTCAELREILLGMMRAVAPNASPRKALKPGFSDDSLTRFVARDFQKSGCQAVIVQPPRCSADLVLSQLMLQSDPSDIAVVPETSVAAPAPVGFVFSSLESM